MKTELTLAAMLGMVSIAGAASTAVPTFLVWPTPSAAAGQDREVAPARISALATGARTLDFSGHTWWVKTSSGRVGPGPNYFSDSPNNVWVDAEGLHLKLTKVKARWYCAEVVSTEVFGYGTYRWELASPVDNLDRNVVLGLFTWSNTSTYANGEIDIEFSRWGSRNVSYPNAQFVVQPYDARDQMIRFTLPAGIPESTHRFLWAPEGVSFLSAVGHWPDEPPASAVILDWSCLLAWPPPTATENARMNLWLYQGTVPSNRLEVEVIIKSFTFEPYPQP